MTPPLRVLASQGADFDATTANGRLVFGIFAALAEFECELITERTRAGLASAYSRDGERRVRDEGCQAPPSPGRHRPEEGQGGRSVP